MPVPPDVRKALDALAAQEARAHADAARAQARQLRVVQARIHAHGALVAGLDVLVRWAEDPETREVAARARAAGLPWVVLRWPVVLVPGGLGRLVVGGGHVGCRSTDVEDLVAHVSLDTLAHLVQDVQSATIWPRVAGALGAHLAARERKG